MQIAMVSWAVPEDVIEDEIIVRLPPKGVAKFKCTSKSYRRRLSRPSFATKYRIHRNSSLCFFSNNSFAAQRFFSADDLSRKAKLFRWNKKRVGVNHALAVAPVASAGNLMVFYKSTESEPSSSIFFIGDPFTRERLELPPPPPALITNSTTVRECKRFLVYGLALYDYDSVRSTRFTFCELTDPADSCRDLMVNKYCSKQRRWVTRVFRHLDINNKFALLGPSVFVNSRLHWLIEEPSSSILTYNPLHDDDDDDTAVSFLQTPGGGASGQESEYIDERTRICRCHAIERQDYRLEYFCKCRFLGECGGKLVYFRVTGDSEFRMWILDQDYDYFCSKPEWCPRGRFVIGGGDPQVPISSLYGGGRVFWSTMTKQGDVLVYLWVGKAVFSYNCSSGKLNKAHSEIGMCPILPCELPSFSVPKRPSRDDDHMEIENSRITSTAAQAFSINHPSAETETGKYIHSAPTYILSTFFSQNKYIEDAYGCSVTLVRSIALYSDIVRLDASFRCGRFLVVPGEAYSFLFG